MRAFDLDAAVTAALGAKVAADSQLALAVSGGPDSLALLLLGAEAFPGRVSALTVDHGLRAGAADEATMVAAHCAALGVPHATLRWWGAKPGANIQAAARAARYALMADWCAAHGVSLLLTAHHADDQAETLLMRLQRGSGTSGLAGIRRARRLQPGVTLVRPLLEVRRAALAARVAAQGWVPVSDPANGDPRYDRTAARALAGSFSVPRLAGSAARLAEAEAALEWATARAFAGNAVVASDGVELDVAGLPDEVVRRLVLQAIAVLVPGVPPRGPAVAALQRRLAAGGAGTLAGVTARGGPVWRFSIAPSRRKQS